MASPHRQQPLDPNISQTAPRSYMERLSSHKQKQILSLEAKIQVWLGKLLSWQRKLTFKTVVAIYWKIQTAKHEVVL